MTNFDDPPNSWENGRGIVLLVGKRGHSNKWCMVRARMLRWNSFVFHDSSFDFMTLYESNFGKLNYYLGAGAKNDGRPAKYPQIDFCELTCLVLSLLHSICSLSCSLYISVSDSRLALVEPRSALDRQGPRSDLLQL